MHGIVSLHITSYCHNEQNKVTLNQTQGKLIQSRDSKYKIYDSAASTTPYNVLPYINFFISGSIYFCILQNKIKSISRYRNQ